MASGRKIAPTDQHMAAPTSGATWRFSLSVRSRLHIARWLPSGADNAIIPGNLAAVSPTASPAMNKVTFC